MSDSRVVNVINTVPSEMDAVRRYRMDGGADFYTQLKFLQRNRPDSGAVRLGDMGTTESNLDPAIKIFHLITSLEVGGEQHGLLINIQGMSKRNFRPIVCSVMDKVPMSGQFEQIGIPVHSLGLRGKYDPRVYWRLWRLLRRERPDILHTHLIHANLLGRIIGRLAGVPAIVASEVTVGRPRRFGTLANRLTNRLIDRIETNAIAVQQWLHETYRTPLDKIRVIPSGVDTGTAATGTEAAEVRKSLGIPRGDRVVLYVGRLEKEKGVEFGVLAFVEIADEFPEVRLVMAGEGRERESLDNIACSSGYTDRIDLIGHTDQIPALMAIADVVLLPSLTEGLSRVILEAMVASRAVVATRVGGSAEVVKDGQTGFIVPARNTSDLADALRRILGDVSLSQRMGQAGRRRVETEFTQERYWDQLSAMYAELVGRKSRKSRRMNSMRFFKAIKFLRTPRFVFAWAREILEDRVITQRHRRHMDDIQTSSLPLAAGIARATAGSEERIDDLLNQSLPFLDRSPRPEDALEWGASSELARLCYTVARIITPEKIVETGIGAGVSSWANLLALHENHRGHLFSIDLPTPNSDRLQSIGYLVPDGLRERWSFALGSSRRHLPEVLRNAGQIDIFLHDSRHSYSNQRFEYRAAWPYLRPGGLLISDDVGNDAFYECAIEFGVAPIFISQAKAVPIGLMVKTT